MSPRPLKFGLLVLLFAMGADSKAASAVVDLPNQDGYWGTPAPPEQRDHAAVYLSRRDLLVAVVPVTTPVPSTEVWALPLADGDAWIRLAIGGPAFGAGLAAVYDPFLDRILVHGGVQSDGRAWVLRIDPEVQWSELPVDGSLGPGVRWEHSAVYNGRRRSVIVFGGNSDHGPLENGWELRLTGTRAHWIPLRAVGRTPGPRVGHAAVYDADEDRMIVIGGALADTEASAWEISFGGQPWRPLSAPGGPSARRAQHSAVLDAQTGSVLVYGGTDPTAPISEDAEAAAGPNDVWELSLRDPITWSLVATSGRTPPRRTRHVALLDPARGRMIVAGGLLPPGIANETWALVTRGQNRWVQLAPIPGNPLPGYTDFLAIEGAMDVRRGRLFVVNSLSRPQGETWMLKFGPDPYWERWPDAPVRNTDVAYDSLRDRLLIHGGFNTSRSNLTWEEPVGTYSYWNPVLTSANPPTRMDLLAVYDSRRDRLAIFGGSAIPPPVANCTISVDAYLLPLAASPAPWSPTAPITRPEGGWFAKGIYDQRGDRLIVMDGTIGCRSPSGGSDLGTWALDLASPTTWMRLSSHPGGFSDADYDRGRSRMIAVRPRFPGIAEAWQLSLESDLEHWRELDVRGIRPTIANETVLAFDPTRDRYVVLSGAGPLAFLIPSRSLPTRPAWSEPIAVDGKQGILASSPSARLELEMVSNPGNRVEVTLSAPGLDPATIELYDVRGRFVRALSIANGASKVNLTGDRELRAGLYFVRLRQGDQSLVRKAVIGP